MYRNVWVCTFQSVLVRYIVCLCICVLVLYVWVSVCLHNELFLRVLKVLSSYWFITWIWAILTILKILDSIRMECSGKHIHKQTHTFLQTSMTSYLFRPTCSHHNHTHHVYLTTTLPLILHPPEHSINHFQMREILQGPTFVLSTTVCRRMVQYINRNMWTPARRTSHSKIMGINM
jgi:hypothetical protein